MKKILMARGADKVVSTCVKVKPGEKVLIITEASRLSIAEAIAAAVYGSRQSPSCRSWSPVTRTARSRRLRFQLP